MVEYQRTLAAKLVHHPIYINTLVLNDVVQVDVNG